MFYIKYLTISSSSVLKSTYVIFSVSSNLICQIVVVVAENAITTFLMMFPGFNNSTNEDKKTHPSQNGSLTLLGYLHLNIHRGRVKKKKKEYRSN